MRAQYFDCLNTMFNILLIIAGILEYVLLGIAFKVSLCSCKGSVPSHLTFMKKGQLPKYIPRRNIDSCGILERFHRILPASKVRSYPCELSGYDTPIMSCRA